MFSTINELAVLVSALLALAIGSVWYSPLVFGKHWQKAAGLTDTDLELTGTDLARSLIVAFLSNTVVLFIIAYLLRLAETYALPRTELALGVVALLGASIVSMVVWEKRSLMYLIIHAGYVALVVITGVCVIGYWPW